MRRLNKCHRDPVRKAGHSLCWWEIKRLAFWLGSYLPSATVSYIWSSCSLGCWRAGDVVFKWMHRMGRYTSTTPLQPSPFLLMEQHWVPSVRDFLCQWNHKCKTKQQPKRQESDGRCWPGKVLLVTTEKNSHCGNDKGLEPNFLFLKLFLLKLRLHVLQYWKFILVLCETPPHILLPRRFLLPLWWFLLSLWSAVAGSW